MKRFAGKKTEKIISYLLLHPNATIPEIIDAIGGCEAHTLNVLQRLTVMGVAERRSTLSKKIWNHPWINEWRILDGSE